jgi:hypothetical protein
VSHLEEYEPPRVDGAELQGERRERHGAHVLYRTQSRARLPEVGRNNIGEACVLYCVVSYGVLQCGWHVLARNERSGVRRSWCPVQQLYHEGNGLPRPVM